MIRRSAFSLFLVLMTGVLLPGDAAAQYGSGVGGGYYGGGGGYHSGDGPRRERRAGEGSGRKSSGPQCYTRRSKSRDGQWHSQKVCE